ncbi:glycosyltransferase family 4 protein [Flavobacterium sp.]|uniref:glycosyltransferase family 4 protein n=1 Tax=Flavobacterium sp. TaxID=239 RepID=UPI0037514F45
MKIAFLTPEYPHEITRASGGIGTSIKNLAESLVSNGHSVRVLVYGQDKEEFFTDKDIVVQRINSVKIKGLSWYFTRKKLEKIIDKLYAEKEIDLLEAPDWTGITSFIQPEKCPVVIRLNGSDTYFCHLDNRPVKWINRFHEKRALQKADAYISVSKYTASLTNQLFNQNNKFTIIPNSINCNNFNFTLLEEDSSKQIILYFGTLIRKKGLLELPYIFNKIMDKHPNVQLQLVGRDSPDIISGNSSTWSMMQAMFSNKALNNVTYIGGVSHNEIKEYISRATICVFPTFAEALPLSWLEAMAMRKAIVASDIGWAEEIIQNGINGYLANPKDHQGYADKINLLLENKDLANQIGINARLRIEEAFDAKKVVIQNVEFYKNSIRKK